MARPGISIRRLQAAAPASARTAEAVLAEARTLVRPAYRAAVERLPAAMRLVAGYHAGFRTADGAACEVAGKAVRPALVLACAAAVGGPEAVPAAVRAAVAVEMVHDFTLLHDDVMDGDPVRRGRPAAWTVFGTAQALLAGDALLAAALGRLRTRAEVRVLAAAVLRLCEGQSADLVHTDRDDVSLADGLVVAERKTGALFGAACELGALSAGADDGASYRAFGARLGVAFQLADDSLGIWGDPERTGKPVGADLVAGKKTPPVLWALACEGETAAALTRQYRARSTWDEHSARAAADLMASCGARSWAHQEARRHAAAALSCLARVGPGPAAFEDLELLAAAMTDRDH